MFLQRGSNLWMAQVEALNKSDLQCPRALLQLKGRLPRENDFWLSRGKSSNFISVRCPGKAWKRSIICTYVLSPTLLSNRWLQSEGLSILFFYYHLQKKTTKPKTNQTTISHSFIILVAFSPRKHRIYEQMHLYLSEAHKSILRKEA